MKRTTFTILSLALCLSASAQHQLSGHLSDVTNGKLVIRVINEAGTNYEKTDTISAANGDFTYDMSDVKGLRQLYISSVPAEGERAKNIATYLAPGEQNVITGTFAEHKFSGSSLFQAYQKYMDMTQPFSEKEDALYKDYQEKSKQEGINTDSLEEATDKQMDAIQADVHKVVLDYIKAHPNEDICAIMCTSTDDPITSFDLLAASVKGGLMKSYIENTTARIQKQREREAKRKEAEKLLQPGMPAPEITLNDLDGKPLSLSSLKGKYVIIDWWGSWCIWCIRGIPKMKEYYAKYSDKMEILSVDCNDTDAKWREAVKKYELPWKHVYMPRDSKLTETYAIQGYPTKCIINPDGTINKIIVGEDPKFYEYLDNLFK